MSRNLVRCLAVVGLALVFAGCAKEPAKPETPTLTSETTPLIERQVLFGNPERAGVQISPDGTKLAWLAPVNDVLNVWVAPVGDIAQARAVTQDKERGIRIYFWAETNNHVVYLQDKGGDENWRVYSTDVASAETRDLTPIDGVQAQIYKGNEKFPEEILIGLNDRDARLHDVYRLNLVTGERKLIEKNTQEFAGYVFDEDYNVRLAMKQTPEGGQEILRKDGDKWVAFQTVPPEDMLTTNPVTFDTAGKTLYVIDSRGRDTAALVALDMATSETKVLGSNPKADVSDLMIHPTKNVPEAIGYTYERREWQVLDPAVQADLDYLRTVAEGDSDVTARSNDDKHWIVAYQSDSGPVRYYHYDRTAHKADYLFSNRPALESLPLAKMHSTVIQASDGVPMVAYYSLPVWTDNDGDGKPTGPLPTVLFVHGGPWARDEWGYNGSHQWLANRGYAVVSVNFRASTGFGKSFVNAGNKEWGARMHDDLVDTVNWAVNSGIADKSKVAIMGGSYGGYATLVGLTKTPELFACGVDIVGPSNLITLIESVPPYWKPLLSIFTTRVGDTATEEGRALLTERSPLTHADKITKPLLIGQGANDPRVKQRESDQIVEAMQAKNIPVTYVVYPDEGHGFARPENRLSFNAVAEAFLAEHLGGKVEAVGDDFTESSIQVAQGASLVKGVAESLPAQAAVADANSD
jgi:dipeptidyl aminopeptidase/acylaminoacyl peptidase